MRFLVKVSFPVEAGNAAAKKDGFKVIQTILEQQKPEAAYFIADGGQRAGILIMDIKEASEIPGIAEPWFLALNASIEATPAMVPEDLQRAGSAIEEAVKTYGQPRLDPAGGAHAGGEAIYSAPSDVFGRS